MEAIAMDLGRSANRSFPLPVWEALALLGASFLVGFLGESSGFAAGVAFAWASLACFIGHRTTDFEVEGAERVGPIAFLATSIWWPIAVLIDLGLGCVGKKSVRHFLPVLATSPILAAISVFNLSPFWCVLAIVGRLICTSPKVSLATALGIVGFSLLPLLPHENVGLMMFTGFVGVFALLLARHFDQSINRHDLGVRTVLVGMLQRSHPYTQGHVNRVAGMAREVGRGLGLPSSRLRKLETAAILHDVGKVTIDEEILDLPRRLTSSEMEHVREHAANGGDILAPLSGMEPVSHWIRCHHERTDGRGYPSGLTNDMVPLESRIIAVIDAYDAMIGGDSPEERRTYRDPMTPEAALAELNRCAGTQFDPRVVSVFSKIAIQERI